MELSILAADERNFDFVADEMVQKLILLFILDKMELPLTDTSMSEIIMANPSWMNYMEYLDARFKLEESKFIYRTTHGDDNAFGLTQGGRTALAHFYIKIPASIREEITDFSKENRQRFKRSQDYTYDYRKIDDGTHLVTLRIKDSSAVDYLLEIKVKSPTRAGAVRAAKKWKDKASTVYETIHSLMLEEGD